MAKQLTTPFLIKMIPVTDIMEKAGTINSPWSPIDVAQVNDQVLRLALFHGSYHWHRHADEDELFYVLTGKIRIKLRDQPEIELENGQLAVVPKGVEHCPEADTPSHVLLFEPLKLKSKGD